MASTTMFLIPLLTGALASACGLDDVALACTLGVCALAALSGMVDPPVAAAAATPPKGTVFADTHIAVLPGPPSCAFVFCAGIGGNIAKSSEMALVHQLNRFGAVVLHERRGFGVERAAHIDPNLETATNDAASAAMVASSLAPRVVLVGFSLGGMPALHLAERTGLPLILVAAFADARTIPALTTAELVVAHLTELSNEAIASRVFSKVLVAHSYDDTYIDYAHSTRLLALLGANASRANAWGDHSHPVLDEDALENWLARV